MHFQGQISSRSNEPEKFQNFLEGFIKVSRIGSTVFLRKGPKFVQGPTNETLSNQSIQRNTFMSLKKFGTLPQVDITRLLNQTQHLMRNLKSLTSSNDDMTLNLNLNIKFVTQYRIIIH